MSDPQLINDSIDIKTIFKPQKNKVRDKLIAILITIMYFVLTPNILYIIWPRKIQNEGVFNCLVVFFAHEIFYFLFNGFFYLVYINKWDFFEKYKVHTLKWLWVSDNQEWKKLVKDTIMLVSFNHFLVVPIILIPNYLKNQSIYRMDYESFPTYTEFIFQNIFFIFVEDFCFYWSHRFLHIKAIYPYFHKVHHRYTNTISVATEYVHPVEYILGNLFPAIAGGLILRKNCHFATFISFVTMRLWKAAENHCGYEFPFSPLMAVPYSGSSSFHNYHHLFFKGNYGSFFCIWDTLLGTVNHKYLKYKSLKIENEFKKND